MGICLEPPDHPAAEGGGGAEKVRGVPVFLAGNITPRQSGFHLNPAGNKIPDFEAGCDITPLNGLKIRQSNTWPANALVIRTSL